MKKILDGREKKEESLTALFSGSVDVHMI